MTREVEGRGATVEEAIQDALAELGVSEQQAEVEIVNEPRGGFLGVGGQEAVVILRTDEPVPGPGADRGEAPPPRVAPMSRVIPEDELEELEAQADSAADFLEELLGHMGIDAVAEPSEHRGHMYVDIVDGPDADMAVLIGRNGQTLDAIQELTRMVVSRRLDTRVRVIVDVQDHRKHREDQLVENARHQADLVLDTGREAELAPMNPFERKLVHDALAELPGVETSSRGEEPNRFVVIRRI